MGRALVGLHARNDTQTFPDVDFDVMRIAKIELLKTMTLNSDEIYIRSRQINPEMQFIVRIFCDCKGQHPTPDAFVNQAIPRLKQLLKWTHRFEIHNEPNLANRGEGWGGALSDAADFRDWFLAVLSKLRAAVPQGSFGFPGLALQPVAPSDLAWAEVCRPAINAADWLGVHCYWQYDHMTDPTWGMHFLPYHQRFPNKVIEITEFGDATPPGQVQEAHIAKEYMDYYTLLQRYAYIGSASSYILSSPDPRWEMYAWRKKDGRITPIPYEVAKVPRPQPQPWAVRWESPQVPTQIPLGGMAEARFTLVNTGTQTWPAGGDHPVRLGYRWFIPGGAEVPATKGYRTALPADLAPGKAVTLTAKFAAPADPGEYVLQWDLVREGVAWFSEEKANPYSVSIKVVLTAESSRFFDETGHVVKQPFLAFYFRYGLPITGYPLTDTLLERGTRTQYFQRIALQATGATSVQLLPIGQELLTARQRLQEITTAAVGNAQKGVEPPPIVDKIHELSRDELAMVQRPLTEITEIVLHHTAVDANRPLADIVAAHRERWPGIVYQYYILADGTILQTEPLTETVSKEQPYLWHGVNICLAGNFTLEIPPFPQLKAAADLIAWLLSTLHLTIHDIYGLSELVQIAYLSPGYQWLHDGKYKERLLALVSEQLQSAADKGALQQLVAQLQEKVSALEASLAQAQKPLPVQPSMQDLVDSLLKHPSKRYATRSLAAITHIAIHHSGDPHEFTPAAIARYHVNTRGWPGIGYHFYIASDGVIYQTNRLETVSYHVGDNNSYAVGVAFNGDFNDDRLPTEAQLLSGGKLVAWLMALLHIPEENVLGHKEFPGYIDSVDCTSCNGQGLCQSVAGHPRCTDCPGSQWKRDKRWFDMLMKQIHAVQV